ncbi:MAG: hypothetical protein HOP12_04235 [Candidatus Eisenbacteria bacterium]|uniref:Uncharacterized protein n=1 Tax=Eiseniibacteriota bacterium TaxID=2212470 RepID=A0A849SDB9_UNCEI|nr:hypothetical protein [Candidatus Eisenbacteria bacterium]
MCPLCLRDNRECKISERPDGHIACECGLHSWPNSAVYQETLRRLDLTVTRQSHIWTQGM